MSVVLSAPIPNGLGASSPPQGVANTLWAEAMMEREPGAGAEALAGTFNAKGVAEISDKRGLGGGVMSG